MATKKHPGRNRPSHQKKKYTPPEIRPSAELTEEEIGEKYAGKGIIRATLGIWRDSSPLTFITYMPIILLHLLYCLFWFAASILAFFDATLEFAVAAHDRLMLINSFVGAIGVPLMLFVLHLVYNIKKKRYYFFNTLIYSLPAGALYILLDFLNTAVAYMFDANAGEIIREKLFVNLIMLAVMAVLTFFLGCIAQFALSIKRQREEPLNVGLPLRLRRK